MSFNQFLGLSTSGTTGGGGGARGPKGDPGSFVWSFGNPPNLTRHLEIHSQPEYIALHRPIVPGTTDTVELGAEDARFRTVYTQSVSTNEVRYLRDGASSADPVHVSYDDTGRSRIRVGDAYQVFGVTTSRTSPDKIDPSLLDITGLRFVDVVSGDRNLHTLLTERPMLQSGDYFVVSSDGLLTYDHFVNEADRHATRGDILVFTSSPDRFVKIPVRVPDYGISTTHLADRSVTSTKLAPAAVSHEHLADASVTSTKLDASLAVRNFRIHDRLSARTFCTNEAEEVADPLRNPTYGITFAESADSVHEGTWRIQSSLESLKFQIWTGTRWIDKFELR